MTLRSFFIARPARPTPVVRPSLILYFLLAGAFLLTLVPHVAQLPTWLSVIIVCAIVLRSVIEVYRLPLPSTTFCGIVAILLLAAIFFQYQTIFGRDAGTAFTAGLLAVKFYELRGPRDVSLIIFSCFFVVMSALLYSQVLELFIYCLIMMWVLTALLLRVNVGDKEEDNLLRMLRGAGIVFLQAFPLAIFLFFFFPRYNGKLSIELEGPSVGLTDIVNPGSIAALAENDSEAMYVRFTSDIIPAPEMMYWRAMVLWDYAGGTWRPGMLADDELTTITPAKPGSPQIAQEITVFPHNQRWLFALDMPVSEAINPTEGGPWSHMRRGNVLSLDIGARLAYKTRYTVDSAPELAYEKLSPTEAWAGTRLPKDEIDPRVTALAVQLNQGLAPGDTEGYVRAVLHYFRAQRFVYSLTPGVQGKDWLPFFLFHSKTGFCEHFASAFAVLMRLEHIPARLVVGYQGAQYNPYTNDYTVLQSNAHAWDEVWVAAKQRWVRVDPTAIFFAAEGITETNGARTDPLVNEVAQDTQTMTAYLPDWARTALDDLKLRREEVETEWDNLVFSYDPEAQSRLAQALGFGPEFRFTLLVACVTLAIGCIVFYRKWTERRRRMSPVETLYADFCRRMARRGIPRSPWEGPLAYTERVAEAFPDDKTAVQRIGSIVTRERYGPTPHDLAAPDDLKAQLNLLSAAQAATTSRDRH